MFSDQLLAKTTRPDASTFAVTKNDRAESSRLLLHQIDERRLRLLESVQFVLTVSQRMKPSQTRTAHGCSLRVRKLPLSALMAARPSAIVLALTIGLAGCAFDKPGIKESPSAERIANVVNGELYCWPGCTLDPEADPLAQPPEWCSKHVVDAGTGELRCIQINLARISEGEGAYAPILVFGEPKIDTDLWRVNCSPGCELPLESFGCDKPAGVAPHLDWCALVSNKCNSGQSQIRVGPIRTTPKRGDDPTPYCTAILASRP